MSSSNPPRGGTLTKNVSVRAEGGVVTLGLSRPPLNILNHEMIGELLEELETAAADRGTKALLLKSDVEGVFSAGADVKDHLPPRTEEFIRGFEEVISAVVAFPRPTVASVGGRCLGGGMELAVACDFVVAARGSTFGQPEINLGVFPPAATSLYPRIAGPKAAADIALTGRSLTAEEAHSMGLVTSVTEPGELDSRCAELLDVLRSKSAVALGFAKSAILESLSLPAKAALANSSRIYLDGLMKTRDASEGLSAFLEKRRPVWQDM